MDDESQPPVSRWATPFWVQFRATVAGGLVLTALLALIALLASQVGNLSAGQILGFIVVPGVVLIVLVMLVYTARTLLRIARQWTAWQGDVSLHVVELVMATRRLYLRDVIRTAESEDWVVYDDDDHDLMFVSPDEDKYFVRATAPDAQTVAAKLNALAPLHFPDDWEPPAEVLSDGTTMLASQTADLVDHVVQLQNELAALEDGLPLKIARAAIQTTMEQAAGNGWEVHDMNTVVQFIHGERGEMATLDLAEPLDLPRLRAALRLDNGD